MGRHMDDWSWGGWLLMTATLVAFWALAAWVVVVAIRANRPPTQLTPDPEQTLAHRFAAGEIDEDEYHRRLDALKGAPSRADGVGAPPASTAATRSSSPGPGLH